MTQPFIFELNFDQLDDSKKNADQLEDPILYSQKNLDASFSDGFDKGRKQGVEEGIIEGELKALTEQQIQMHNAFLEINKKLSLILQHEVTYEKKIQENVKAIVLNLIDNLLPLYMEQHGSEELLLNIHNILEKTMKSESIHIFVHPSIVSDLKEQVEDLKNIFNKKEIKINFIDDPNIPQWDAKIEWSGGGARWQTSDTFNKLQSIIANNF